MISKMTACTFNASPGPSSPPPRPLPVTSTPVRRVPAVAAAAAVLLTGPVRGAAQIVTDGTLGPATTLTGPAIQIPHTLGTLRGPNLFHSFERFGIPSGTSATFAGPDSVGRVISRVTGGHASQLDGTLRCTIPGADVFLVNPSGVVFGPNSALDVKGSFAVTTADHVILADGGRFDARQPALDSLTVAAPAAFGFLDPGTAPPAAPIEFQGASLAVPAGRDFTIVGGPVSSRSDPASAAGAPRLRAWGGTFQIAAVASGGTLPLDSFDTGGFATLASVSFSGGTVAATGNEGGGGRYRIRAQDLVIGADSGLNNYTRDHGEGRTCEIDLRGRLTLDEGFLASISDGTAHASDLTIHAGSVHVREPMWSTRTTGILTTTSGSGRAGDIRIDAGSLVLDGGLLSAATLDSGPAGDIVIRTTGATEVNGLPWGLLSGQVAHVGSDSLQKSAASGPAGTVDIEAASILIKGTAAITAFTDGGGPGGTVRLEADRVTLDGRYSVPGFGQPEIQVLSRHSGPAGSIWIEAREFVSTQGRIDADGLSLGDAGTIEIEAERVSFADPLAGITASAPVSFMSARGGRITVRAEQLSLSNQASIEAVTAGYGDGGRIDITASEVSLASVASLRASSTATSRGSGGTVRLATRDLALDGLASIEAGTSGQGAGGNIDIQAAGEVRLEGGAYLSANAYGTAASGSAGSVSVEANRLFLGPLSSITSSTGGAARGADLRIVADEVELAGGTIMAASVGNAAGNGGNIELRARRLVLADGARVTTESEGSGNSGRILAEVAEASLAGASRVTSTAGHLGDAGSIEIVASADVRMADGSSIDSAAQLGHAGSVAVRAGSRIESSDSSWSVESASGDAGSVVLDAADSLHLQNTSVLALAGNDGGNINLSGGRLVGLADVSLNANAVSGHGGHIELDAGFLYRLGAVEITAISENQAAAPGTIAIRSGVDFANVVARLPDDRIRLDQTVRDGCARRHPLGNSLIVRGRGGMGPRPDAFLPDRDALSADEPGRDTDPDPAHKLQMQVAALARIDPAGEPGREAELRLELASALGRQGRHCEAFEMLEPALPLAERAAAPALRQRVFAALGQASLGSRRYAEAEDFLRASLALARQLDDARAQAGVLQDLGCLLAVHQVHLSQPPRRDEARGALILAPERPVAAGSDAPLQASLECFREARALAGSSGHPEVSARIELNEARTRLRAGPRPSEAAQAALDAASRHVELLPRSREKAFLLAALGDLGLALAAPDASAPLPSGGVPWPGTEASFARSAAMAGELSDPATSAFARLGLARLEEHYGRIPAARRLAEDALFVAQGAGLAEPTFEAEWFLARLLRGTGQTEESLAAYRRALRTLALIRSDLSASAALRGDGRPYRESSGRIHLEFADLLLAGVPAGDAPERHEAVRQSLLQEAQHNVERLKSAELEDYLLEADCASLLESRTVPVSAVGGNAAVLYIIPLPDRTELLVTLADGIRRFVSPTGRAKLASDVAEFRLALEHLGGTRHLVPARRLWETLVAPVLPTLEAAGIGTLVFVPDGPLRTIPLAALHDGAHYLIERFAVGISPGLSLMAARPLPRAGSSVLACGLSAGVQGYPALPAVPGELDGVLAGQHGRRLVDEAFLTRTFEDEVRTRPYSVIHLASHGEIARDPRESFLLTFDGRVRLSDLETLIRPRQLEEQPLELLVLSACQTAAGDDRAALGLAGIAVQAGARSALATLWAVHDEATRRLMTAFYESLRAQPAPSKAEALRSAQRRLLGDPEFHHPAYWSPYLLVGNWL